MHGSGGDWSTPKRSSKSKKKWRHCWVSHWRRQTATTSHDGCSCCPGADTRSDRQCLRGSERVARQRLPPTRPSGPAVGRALSQTEPTACADHRGTTNYARPSARAALCLARGTVLGGFRGRAGTCTDLEKARATRTAKANQRAVDLAPTIRGLRAEGSISLHAIASGLNSRQIAAARGGKWSAAQVRSVVRRLGG